MLTPQQRKRLAKIRQHAHLDYGRALSKMLRDNRRDAELLCSGYRLTRHQRRLFLVCLICHQEWIWPVSSLYRLAHRSQCTPK